MPKTSARDSDDFDDTDTHSWTSDSTDDDDSSNVDDWCLECGENLERRVGRPSGPYNSAEYVSAASGVAGRSGLDSGRVSGSAVLPAGS